MKSNEIRQKYLDFFKSKTHKIVASAPIVVKDDPTLMFTNAGMNQFKDYFLGNKVPDSRRVADTQKCLRVSGKHNDLEEVGRDSYHHTMFEMLGNWSFGDYFKKEAIDWAWELLTDVYGLDKDRLYVSVFKGEESEGLSADMEAVELWKNHVAEDRILYFDKKDNFWEMGDTGPCGPCSEIHIDLRSDEDRAKVSGATLVNEDDPEVIEVWNLVFIQYNRKADSSLEPLPEKHVDTGMGFERLAMAIQGKKANYDTDIFSPYINKISADSGIKYTGKYDDSSKTDIAMRVLSDHIRAVAFTIADGQMPDNSGAGYVIRRILRRAVRYYYSFLNIKEPYLYTMIPMLADDFKDVFSELFAQKDFVTKVILEEEKGFLRTLEGGLKRIASLSIDDNVLDGKTAFELYDTYGFPIDLTNLIAEENGWDLDEVGFGEALAEQKARSRADAEKSVGDWIDVNPFAKADFQGYDTLSVNGVQIMRYRTVETKGKESFQVLLDKTPFYPEGGGQVGDKGTLKSANETLQVYNTTKENDLIIHHINVLPQNAAAQWDAQVEEDRRRAIENNHSATHLLHAALKEVLGDHVNQKGSLVKDSQLRFDFSHMQKMSDEEIAKVESIVNQRIQQNIALKEDRSIPIDEAKASGAMMLFGEKYGDTVRMITFDPTYSIELCGGCHVPATGKIGVLKILSESGVAAGVRRIEAVTGSEALTYINNKLTLLDNVELQFKSKLPVSESVAKLIEENKILSKQVESLKQQNANGLIESMSSAAISADGYKVIQRLVDIDDSKIAKNLVYSLAKKIGESVILIGIESNGKPQLICHVTEELAKSRGFHAGNIVKTLAQTIKGGGGGQANFATAGGSDASKLQDAIDGLGELLS